MAEKAELSELQRPFLATVTVDLKTLRISREFFPDIIVYHKCQSNRKICKKCLLISSPQVSHSDSLGHPLLHHHRSCKGTQCNTGRDHCGFFLSHPTSRRTSLQFKDRARAATLARGSPLYTVLQDIPLVPAPHIPRHLFRELVENPGSRPPLSRVG